MQGRLMTQALAVMLVATTLTLGSGCSIFQKKGGKGAPGSGGSALPPVGAGTDVSTGGAGGRVDLGSGVEERGLFPAMYFDYDSVQIKNQGERAKLVSVANGLKGNKKKLLIEGHCDERGTAEYNRALGERRAQTARNELIKLGVEANRITTISYGKDRPVDATHGDTAWSRNRRCEFVLVN